MSAGPLIFIIFLIFAFVVALALVIWYALTMSTRTPARPVRQKPNSTPEPLRPRPAKPVSNDQIRGAKAPGSHKRAEDGDAFERFIRTKNDDLEF